MTLLMRCLRMLLNVNRLRVCVARNVQCTLARVATTTPLLSVSPGQPELRKLAAQYAARLVFGCVVCCRWRSFLLTCVQDPVGAPKGVAVAHSRRYVQRVSDASVWIRLMESALDFHDAAPKQKDLGMCTLCRCCLAPRVETQAT